MKSRTEPEELKISRTLNERMTLSNQDKDNYENVKKGYEGELAFDEWTIPLLKGRIVLNDVLLKQNNTVFQIDSLFITPKKILLFEVKNFEGDYYIEDDRWFSMNGKEIRNPLHQMQRSTILLQDLLKRTPYTIEPYLIFVNPGFHLYQAQQHPSIIYPTQLNRFLSKMKKEQSHITDNSKELAKHILKLHLTKNPNTRIPEYQYSQLQKGMVCPNCHVFYENFFRKTMVCTDCGGVEFYKQAVLRSAKEYQVLFPESKITTNRIYEWCGMKVSKNTIQRCLSKEYHQLKKGRSSYYSEK